MHGTPILSPDTAFILLAAGLILLGALGLGVWKYQQMNTSEQHVAHPYVDIAHRAALLYAFATLLIAALAEFGDWPTVVNLVTSGVVVAFFVAAIATYVYHGWRADTTTSCATPSAAPAPS